MEYDPLNYIKLHNEFETYELDNRYSSPLWDYYYNYRSLLKFWEMTKENLNTLFYKNKSLFDEDKMDDDTDIDDDSEIGDEIPIIDGQEMTHDYEFIPFIQRCNIICTGLSLVESVLKKICRELNENYELNNKGSYIQQTINYIKKNTIMTFNKEYLRNFEAFGHIRNSYLHQLNIELPTSSILHLNKKTGPFLDIKKDISNKHVDICLNILNNFGKDLQEQYWKNYDKTIT